MYLEKPDSKMFPDFGKAMPGFEAEKVPWYRKPEVGAHQIRKSRVSEAAPLRGGQLTCSREEERHVASLRPPF
ncbi:hypothetical protein [Sulfidibacter corallicola]|uniref:Uncharacterized protein n=1 Tax=Sulfidibacter corallicola TaxID=2818388 RepID=A0A8A4TJL5_SULCO|nr:hypothetical protein [Sulfidibacter corallicola]QTD49394.1 hypothetical protein J3U87_27735 [Sulfidibacter corallicola]